MKPDSPPRPPAAIDAMRAGIGLRTAHYADAWAEPPDISFLEVHSENYFGAGGQPLAWLERFRSRYPLSLHGVGLSLGSTDALNMAHLANLKRLAERFEPALVSEHLCWVSVAGRYLNDLLPLPYTKAALDHVVAKVVRVQDFLKRRILVENVSSYLQFADSDIPEWEFVAELAARAGCGILLDVNNIYVNACNHGFDADRFVEAIAPGSVGEIHLAGFQRIEEPGGAAVLIDTHGSAVCDDVWALYARAIARFGPVPTLIEWDTDIPPLSTLVGEARKADRILDARRVRAA